MSHFNIFIAKNCNKSETFLSCCCRCCNCCDTHSCESIRKQSAILWSIQNDFIVEADVFRVWFRFHWLLTKSHSLSHFGRSFFFHWLQIVISTYFISLTSIHFCCCMYLWQLPTTVGQVVKLKYVHLDLYLSARLVQMKAACLRFKWRDYVK